MRRYLGSGTGIYIQITITLKMVTIQAPKPEKTTDSQGEHDRPLHTCTVA